MREAKQLRVGVLGHQPEPGRSVPQRGRHPQHRRGVGDLDKLSL
jgi:hypothetical protein